jgi:hypothetical protein
VYSPPISGPNAGDINYIQVQIKVLSKTYFAGILGINQIPVSSEAVTRTKRPVLAEILQGNAIISLAPTSNCEDKKSFDVSGESTLAITGGGIFVNSSNPTCALSQWGSGSIRLRDKDQQIFVVGGVSIRKPQLLTPYPPQTGATPISYPPPFIFPKVSCNRDAVISDDGKSMTAGDWADDFPPPGVVSLSKGVYCLGGDFILNDGILEGNGVVFLLAKGQLHFGGSASIRLSAPTSGNYQGLLIFAPIDNRNIIALNGNSDSGFTGTVLAPGAQVRLKGNKSAFGFHTQIVGYTIMSDGNSNIIIDYREDQNYHAMTMPEIQFSQ